MIDRVWPADRHQVPDWRIRAETRARALDLRLVSYRTLEEFEVAIALTAARLAQQNCTAPIPKPHQAEVLPSERAQAGAVQPNNVVPLPVKPPVVVETVSETLEPLPFARPPQVTLPGVGDRQSATNASKEAEQFLSWLIATHRIGSWSHEEMRDFYRCFCRDTSRTPIPESALRAELKKLTHGAKKSVHDGRRGSKGRGPRNVVWRIEGNAKRKAA